MYIEAGGSSGEGEFSPRSTATIEDTLWRGYSKIEVDLAGVDAILDENLGTSGGSLKLKLVDGLEDKQVEGGQKSPDSHDEILVDLSSTTVPVGLRGGDSAVAILLKPPDQSEVNRRLYRAIQAYIDFKNKDEFIKPEDLRLTMNSAEALLNRSCGKVVLCIISGLGSGASLLSGLAQSYPEEVSRGLPYLLGVSVVGFAVEARKGGQNLIKFNRAKTKYERESKFGQYETRMTLAENAMDVNHGPIITFKPRPIEDRIVYL